MLFYIIFSIFSTCSLALPVIFGYQSNGLTDTKHYSSDSQNYFIAAVNKRLKRPMSVHGDAVRYNVDEADLPNFIPTDDKVYTTQKPQLEDIHPSYKEVVTRSTRIHEDIEECYGNEKLLPRRVLKKMNKKRRKLAQSIRKLNKLQRTYCLGRKHSSKTEKCPSWRNEKMALYVKLMQLTHCSTKLSEEGAKNF